MNGDDIVSCGVGKCLQVRRLSQLACRAHMRRLPTELQTRLERQANLGHGNEAHIAIVQECCEWWTHDEWYNCPDCRSALRVSFDGHTTHVICFTCLYDDEYGRGDQREPWQMGKAHI